MDTNTFQPARFSKNFKYIIDSNGKKIKLNDPRVTHVVPYKTDNYLNPLFEKLYQKRGFNFRCGDQASTQNLAYSKQFLSGRECFSLHTILAGIYKDVLNERKSDDEIVIYSSIEEEGPCQTGAWPIVNEQFIRKYQLRNVLILGHQSIRNNYIGQGTFFSAEIITTIFISGLLNEIEGVLKCIARDKINALQTYKKITDGIIASSGKSLLSLEMTIRKSLKKIRQIPLEAAIKETPRILIFGGGAVALISHPVIDYFQSNGILAKPVCVSEFILHLESEYVLKYGFKRKLTHKKKFSIPRLLLSFLNPKNNLKEAFFALRSRISILGSHLIGSHYYNLIKKSGKLYDEYIPYLKIIEEGNKHVPFNIYIETTEPIGRYLQSIKNGVFDAFVHISVFNCQPSKESQMFIRDFANNNDIPFAGIELENSTLTSDHLKILETIAIQAKRTRKNKNN